MSAVGGPLERRYRWLLSCYPRTHRAEYGEEMLGVLLADASGGPEGAGGRRARRWPAPGAAADLLAGAGRAWLRRSTSAAVRGRWSAVVVVLGVALPLAMAPASVPAFQAIAHSWHVYRYHWQPFTDPQVLLSCWVVVFALTFTRLRRVTAAAAWLCAAPQVLFPARWMLPAVPDLVRYLLRLGWPVAGLVAATALTLTAAHARAARPDAPHPPRGPVALLGAAGLGFVLATAADFVLVRCIALPVGGQSVRDRAWSAGGPVGWWLLVAVAVAVPLAATLLLARRLGAAVALRVVGVAAGVAAPLLTDLGGSLVVYTGPDLVRWTVVPVLAVALPMLAARLVDRRAAVRDLDTPAGPTGPEGSRG